MRSGFPRLTCRKAETYKPRHSSPWSPLDRGTGERMAPRAAAAEYTGGPSKQFCDCDHHEIVAWLIGLPSGSRLIRGRWRTWPEGGGWRATAYAPSGGQPDGAFAFLAKAGLGRVLPRRVIRRPRCGSRVQ